MGHGLLLLVVLEMKYRSSERLKNIPKVPELMAEQGFKAMWSGAPHPGSYPPHDPQLPHRDAITLECPAGRLSGPRGWKSKIKALGGLVPSAGCGGRLSSRLCSLAYRWPPSSDVSPHCLFSLGVSILKLPLFCRDTSRGGLVPTLMTLS